MPTYTTMDGVPPNFLPCITDDALVHINHIANYLNMPPMIVADVGACVGDFARRLHMYIGDAVIHMFEPLAGLRIDRRNLDLAVDYVKTAHVHNVAVGDKDQVAKFYRTIHPDDSSLLKPTMKKVVEEILVPEIRLESWAKTKGVPKLDLVKMDIQGGELKAIKGMGKLLETTRFILAEVSFKKRYKNQPTLPDISRYLEKRKYGLFQLYDVSPQEANALFVRGYRFKRYSNSFHLYID